ncbi:MAG TPA: hypothetical protein ENJ28_03405 [Gammaproteobacteria bacterium]|nr:hypothetical protein [Gammaproteobacteria bacterium]
MFFWQKVDYDWKSCAQRHKAQEQKKSSRKGKLRRLFCNRLFWALVCLLATAIVSFHGYDVHASYTPYVFFGGLVLSILVLRRRGVETGQADDLHEKVWHPRYFYLPQNIWHD